MPQNAWSDKRERQYEHIKESYKDRGVSNDEAEERAARTVNKERAEHGETKSSGRRKRS
jgi:plasmid stabilization system protein ParE